MRGYLLDTNVLVALLWPSHTLHATAIRWFSRHRARKWATCPMTETAFVRIVSNPAFSRDAVTPREAVGLLESNTAAADHLFWPADLPVGAAATSAGPRLVGHQQVADAYLLALATANNGMLATLDQGVTSLTLPKSAERRAIELIA